MIQSIDSIYWFSIDFDPATSDLYHPFLLTGFNGLEQATAVLHSLQQSLQAIFAILLAMDEFRMLRIFMEEFGLPSGELT